MVPVLPAVSQGTTSHDPSKRPRKMAVIVETGIKSNFSRLAVSFTKQVTGGINTYMHEVITRRGTKQTMKMAIKLTA